MDKKPIIDVLKLILDKINSRKLFWRLEGSVNLFVQEVKVLVNDIDITTDPANYRLFKEIFADYIVKERYVARKKEQSLLCRMHGWEIEIVYYENAELNMFDKIKTIEWNGLILPILPLPYAKEFYRLIGKTEKADLIQGHLDKLEKPSKD